MLRTAAVFVAAFFLGGPGAAIASSPRATVQHWEIERDTLFIARMKPLEIIAHAISQAEPSSGTSPAEGPAGASPTTTGTQAPTEEQRTPPDAGMRVGGASNSGESMPVQGVGTGGLLVNETFTVTGSQFYRAFYEAWSVPEAAATYNFTITVAEAPAPRLGTQLTVVLEGTTLFQSRLRPNTEGIKQMARQAAQRASLYLRRYYEPRTVY